MVSRSISAIAARAANALRIATAAERIGSGEAYCDGLALPILVQNGNLPRHLVIGWMPLDDAERQRILAPELRRQKGGLFAQ